MEGMSIVITCAHFSLMFLKMTLWSLEEFSALNNELVIVVDRGSKITDRTEEWLQSQGYAFHVVHFKDVYKAWDFGVQQATKNFVCMVPQDFVYSPEWDINLLKHVNPFSTSSRYLAAWSFVIGPDSQDFWGPRILEYNCCKSGKEIFQHQGAPNGFDLEKFLQKVEEIKRPNETDGLHWFQPFVVNRQIFLEIGGWYNNFCRDEPWPYQHEECTLSKLRSLGVEIVRSLDSIVYHFGSSIRMNINPQEAWEYNPWEIYKKR